MCALAKKSRGERESSEGGGAAIMDDADPFHSYVVTETSGRGRDPD